MPHLRPRMTLPDGQSDSGPQLAMSCWRAQSSSVSDWASAATGSHYALMLYLLWFGCDTRPTRDFLFSHQVCIFPSTECDMNKCNNNQAEMEINMF